MHKKSDLPFPSEVQRKVRKEGVNFLVGMLGFSTQFFAQNTSILCTALLMYEMKSAAIEKWHTMCVHSFYIPLNSHFCSCGILGLKHLAFNV